MGDKSSSIVDRNGVKEHETLSAGKTPFKVIVISAILASVIFVFDLAFPLGVATGVPYVALVFTGMWYSRSHHIYLLAVLGSVLTIIGYFTSPDGGIFWVVLLNRGLALFAIWITAFLVVVSRMESLSKLKSSEKRFLDIAERASDWFWEMGPDFRFTYLTNRFFDLTGINREDIIGTRRKEHSDTAETKAEKESWERHIADLQAHRPFKDFEYGFKLDDERIMYVRVSGTPIFDSDGLFLGYRGAASDITEKKEAERALRISQQRLLLHRDQSPIGVIEWNTDFTFNDWNPAAERIFGFTKEEVQNQHITDRILPESARPAVDKIWEDLLAQKGGTYSLNENITKEGRIILCEWHNTPLVDEDGNVIGVTSIVDDVTERVATDHAQLEKEKAEAAAQAKGEFLANMSHEIRTPLTAVLGMAKIGIRDCKDSRDKGTFNQIFDSGRHLLRIINDILDFSKIEAGKLTIETSPFQLISTVENPVNMLIERALAKDLKLSVNLPSSLPGWVLGDPLRLQQILLNLVSNAIKFTAEGEVLVSVSRVGSMTHFKVTDTGVGLNEEQVSRLFTPFEQADTSTTRNYGGTGLGLAISYNLAKLMGGKISVESQVNRGSTFTLSLPFSETDTPNIKDSAAPEKLGPQLEGLQVLAAEDVDLNRLILEDILEQEGASVVFAEDGQQAIDHLQQIGVGNIDVVLMDIQMPVMDGYEATRRIVEMAPGLPVIGITAHALVEERDKCFAAGMVDIVTKPFEIEDLITSLKQHVDRFAMILK